MAQCLPLPAHLHLPGSRLSHHPTERREEGRGEKERKRESHIEEGGTQGGRKKEGRQKREAWREKRKEND